VSGRRHATIGAATLLVASALAAACAGSGTPLRVTIAMRYSAFSPSSVVVPGGRPVTFVLRNDDPIDHEWIVGDAALHERHRTGDEPHHGERPTEVSVPALGTVESTVTFTAGEQLTFACHLPGHEAYGMVGRLDVD
jgi:uncharacterized cupredoxin-like copper-binding protein